MYDGWNLIAERVTPAGGAETVTRYVWGLDLSQRVQGAGGIGGLLLQDTGTKTRLYTYEANGNVGQLVDGTTGVVVAHYAYDPFGTTLTASGTAAEANPFRFSTKYTDADTTLLDYGYRFYSPTLGRWLTRDPIGERGDINLYAFARNNPIGGIDVVGLFCPGAKPYNSSTYGVGNSSADLMFWIAGKKAMKGIFNYPLAYAAMSHADCTINSWDWNLTSSECERAKMLTLKDATEKKTGLGFQRWLKGYLFMKYSTHKAGTYKMRSFTKAFTYKYRSEGYYAFGDADLSFDGDVSVCKSGKRLISITMKATVKLFDYFYFGGYDELGTKNFIQPTAIGYRLETSGFIRKFKVLATWEMEVRNGYSFW